jgi:hypothetical protein
MVGAELAHNVWKSNDIHQAFLTERGIEILVRFAVKPDHLQLVNFE